MMLDGHEDEPEPVEELDSVERGDSHVEEDSEDHRVWHQTQKRRQKDGKADEQGHTKSCDALICKKNIVLAND
jgi:hypothetical protein